MTVFRKVLWLLLATTASIGNAQTTTNLPIIDSSDAGAPVRVGGQVKLESTPPQWHTFDRNLTLTITSPKPVLLVRVTLDIVTPFKVRLYESVDEDYFFESSVLQPGSVIQVPEFLGPFGEPGGRYVLSKIEPSARAKVLFVEFLDGSTWGDPTAARDLLKRRQASLQRLEMLRAEYLKYGTEAFVKEMLKPTNLQPVAELQSVYAESQNATAALMKLDEMLANARVRAGSVEGDVKQK